MLAASRGRLSELERRLAEAAPGERHRLVLGVAVDALVLALPGFAERGADEAAVYVENYPMPGLPLGDVDDRAAAWLVVRYGGTTVPAHARSVLATLAEAARKDFPAAAAGLAELAARPPADDPAQDELWLELVRAVVARR